MTSQQSLSPPAKKSRIFGPEEGGGGEAMGSESGRLWVLATVACWLAEEEERQRKTERKASPFEEVGSFTPLEVVVEEEEGQRKATHPADEEEQRRKGKAEVFAEVGSCSRSAAADLGRGITSPVVVAKRNSRPYKKKREEVVMGWVEKAVRMGGTPPQLVVKKVISETDLDPHYARLPLPFYHPRKKSMGGVERLVAELSPAEHEAVHGDKGLAVTVLDRWGREYHDVIFKKWPSKWYVLINGKVVSRILQGNALKADDVVEFFSFRVGQHGRLVLVVSVADAVAEEEEMQHGYVEEEEEEHGPYPDGGPAAQRHH